MSSQAVVLQEIPFSPDAEALGRLLRLSDGSDQTSAWRGLLDRAAALARPKALYKVSYVENRGESTVDIDGIRFSSTVLSRNLRQVGRVFPYLATCGNELEELQSSCSDLLARYWLDALKELALRSAVQRLKEHLGERYLGPDARSESDAGMSLSSMNPGSGDRGLWPLAQQRPLFRLLGDTAALIGVRLTESFLMTPNKTVSGILFPSEERFENCQLCTREGCPGRRAPYRGSSEAPGR